MSTENKKFASEALEVNLAQTRKADIVIPDEQKKILKYSESYWGINKRTKDFLQELNHPYANYQFLVDEYRKIILGDFWLYEQHNEGKEAFLLLLNIADNLLSNNLSNNESGQLLRTLMEFAGVCSKSNMAFRETVIAKVFSILESIYQNNRHLLIKNSGLIKKHFKGLAVSENFSQLTFEFTKKIALANLDYWTKNAKAGEWFDKNKKLFEKDYSKEIKLIERPFFDRIKKNIEASSDWKSLCDNVPFFNDITEHFRRFIDKFEKSIEKFYYIIFLLHLPGMESSRNQLLWELNRILRNIHDELRADEIVAFIDNIFSLFKELKHDHMSTVLDCILTLGKEVISIKERKIISYFENKLIELGFVTPGLVYIQENWQLKIDPNHLKNIRVWLELIEHAPYTFRKLLSALIVNLRLGGIFIFDTDLFQRDITMLLNSDISPLYKQIKQLTRIFPVYFNEIGAEGDLRDVTTVMDEISGRQDKLIHFLRKQVHIEGNNSHIDLTRKIFQFWFDGNLDNLKPHIPVDVYAAIDKESHWFTNVHQIINQMCLEKKCKPVDLLTLSEDEFGNLLEEIENGSKDDKKRLRLLFRLYNLLKEKYSFETTDITTILKKYPFFEEKEIYKLDDHLNSGNTEKAIGAIYKFMEKLNQVIFSKEYSQGWESIYHKRHIAFGIPSMYGQYRETKFEALGVIFRLEKLASKLMEKRIYGFQTEYITAKALKESYQILKLFQKGLELDGVTSQVLDSNLQMLKYGLTSQSFSLDQFINLFQFIAKNVKEITYTYFFSFYDQPLRMIIPQLFDTEKKLNEKELNQLIVSKSEVFYREILYSSFLIQLLDNFVSRIIHSLQNMVDNFSQEVIRRIMSYDSDLIISPLYKETLKVDNQIFLGSKALYQKKLYLSGFPVPPGFVLTTEVFRSRRAILSNPTLSREVDDLVKSHIKKLEKLTGQLYGSPENPLLLSVRSGTAISMPGAMNTFLNVGMNDKIVEAFSRQPNFGWTSWDCYRRFLQSWGMTYGINRDIFDQVMIDYKNIYKIDQKIHFTSRQMREIAFAYKEILEKNNVKFEEDPWQQLKQAIMSVFDSWSSKRAIVYRDHLQIAEEWGTAVVIQKMVLGNIYDYSGTGVVFTYNPQIQKPGIYLNGDFTMCSQGEDIVAGLVHALPVSVSQKQLTQRENQISLEERLPEIYNRLYEIAYSLVEKLGYNHQEIEFTYESENPEDLYILQIRDQDTRKVERMEVFSEPVSNMKLLARGIGGGGGALTGRLAIDMEDIKMLRKKYPDEKCILVRPDTVPDDIPIIFECDGLVAARGGTTSHAAVTAARLGKTCVLNCHHLIVYEKEKECSINGHILKPGDKISIDGFAGNIFSGYYKTELTEIVN